MGKVFVDRKIDFVHLKQMGDLIMEYKVKYVRMSRYYPKLVATQKDWFLKFINGLHFEIQNTLLTLEMEDFQKVVSATMREENLQQWIKDFGKRSQEQRSGFIGSGGIQTRKLGPYLMEVKVD